MKDLNKDKEAVRSYFLNYVNKHTQFFHSLREKLDYMIENEYYEKEFLDKYTFEEIESVYDIAYNAKFRFPTYMGAFKFYNDYAMKSNDERRVFLERYEDRLSIIALYHADGDVETKTSSYQITYRSRLYADNTHTTQYRKEKTWRICLMFLIGSG
ncbi:hypothetical protein MGH68_05505 [Erysipelothrix sp. D19-032]